MSNLLKLPSLSEAERRAARNLASLTPKELAVAQHILEGETTKEIARLLGNSPRTIECHRGRILNKLGIHGASDLLRVAVAAAQRPSGTFGVGTAPAPLNARASEDLEAFFSVGPQKGSASPSRLREVVGKIEFCTEARPDAVNVYLTDGGGVKPLGFILVPEPLAFELGELQYPALNVLRPLAGAVSYGLFLSLELGLPLNITGERAVWNGGPDAPADKVTH
jgi:DNA-binding CsgD family transcriptional regulator